MSMDAIEILHSAEICIGDRAASRDLPDGERSMARTVAAFNAFTGRQLSERDGWLFMCCLKAAWEATPGGRHNPDDCVDLSAYAALMGECAGRNQ